MKIGKPNIKVDNSNVIFSVEVESFAGQNLLWYELDAKYVDIISDSCDAPLVALLVPAMERGEDIYIEGVISEKLYYNLLHSYQYLLRQTIPELKLIKIYPSATQSQGAHAEAVATGFSAGVDSYCTLADHFYSDVVPIGYQISHLLFNNVGSHGPRGEELFNERFMRLDGIASRLGIPLVKVNSNLDSFYSSRMFFQQTHTPRNTSVALLLQKGIGKYMYSSGINYSDMFVGKTTDTAYSDAITLPLLSTHCLDAFSVGGEYTRVQKTIRVSNLSESYTTLDVCVNDDGSGNCSHCWKCMRTQLTLDIAGVLNHYSGVFNLDAYAFKRNEYIAQVLSNNSPLSREIIEYAIIKGFRFPLHSRFISKFMSINNGFARVANLPLRLIGKLRGKHGLFVG